MLRHSLPLALVSGAVAVACGGNTASEGLRDSGHVQRDAGGRPPVVDSGPAADRFVAPLDAGVDARVPTGPGVLLFAGYGEAPLNDTWLWSAGAGGTAWTEVDDGTGPSPSPSIRSDEALIGYQGKVLLFGGQGLGPDLGDTWVWDGKWTELKVSGPSAREGAAVAVLHDKVILFGGTAGSAFLADTWEWDGTSWTELEITGPTNRSGAAMAALGDELVLFGSLFDTATWLFDGMAWTMSTATGPTGEAGGLSGSRSWQSMATLGDKVVLFGGEQDANHILRDTWTFDGTAWTEVSTTGPGARWHAGMTAFEGKLLLFGGAGVIPANPWYGDTWTWDGTSWTQVATTGPSDRYSYTLGAFLPQ